MYTENGYKYAQGQKKTVMSNNVPVYVLGARKPKDLNRTAKID